MLLRKAVHLQRIGRSFFVLGFRQRSGWDLLDSLMENMKTSKHKDNENFELMKQLRTYCVKEDVDNALATFETLYNKDIELSEDIKDKLLDMCYEKSHIFEYAVKFTDLHKKLGRTIPYSYPGNVSFKDFDYDNALREANRRMIDLVTSKNTNARKELIECYNIIPKISHDDAQKTYEALPDIRLNRLKYVIRNFRKLSIQLPKKLPKKEKDIDAQITNLFEIQDSSKSIKDLMNTLQPSMIDTEIEENTESIEAIVETQLLKLINISNNKAKYSQNNKY